MFLNDGMQTNQLNEKSQLFDQQEELQKKDQLIVDLTSQLKELEDLNKVYRDEKQKVGKKVAPEL